MKLEINNRKKLKVNYLKKNNALLNNQWLKRRNHKGN